MSQPWTFKPCLLILSKLSPNNLSTNHLLNSLTTIGCGIESLTQEKHCIKRAHRLLSHTTMQQEVSVFYAAMAGALVRENNHVSWLTGVTPTKSVAILSCAPAWLLKAGRWRCCRWSRPNPITTTHIFKCLLDSVKSDATQELPARHCHRCRLQSTVV